MYFKVIICFQFHCLGMAINWTYFLVLGAARKLAKTNDGIGLPLAGRVRFSSRRCQSGHQHRPQADGHSQAVPGESAEEDVRQWASQVRGHRLALRSRKKFGWRHSLLHNQKEGQ